MQAAVSYIYQMFGPFNCNKKDGNHRISKDFIIWPFELIRYNIFIGHKGSHCDFQNFTFKIFTFTFE